MVQGRGTWEGHRHNAQLGSEEPSNSHASQSSRLLLDCRVFPHLGALLSVINGAA